MKATAEIVLRITVEYDYDAAGDDDVAAGFARNIAEHLVETFNGDDSILLIEQLISCGLYDRSRPAEGAPPYDAATATGMYDPEG